jgi:hypothetical protein
MTGLGFDGRTAALAGDLRFDDASSPVRRIIGRPAVMAIDQQGLRPVA